MFRTDGSSAAPTRERRCNHVHTQYDHCRDAGSFAQSDPRAADHARHRDRHRRGDHDDGDRPRFLAVDQEFDREDGRQHDSDSARRFPARRREPGVRQPDVADAGGLRGDSERLRFGRNRGPGGPRQRVPGGGRQPELHAESDHRFRSGFSDHPQLGDRRGAQLHRTRGGPAVAGLPGGFHHRPRGFRRKLPDRQ